MFAFFNIKAEDIEIKKGDVIGQTIFQKYLTVWLFQVLLQQYSLF